MSNDLTEIERRIVRNKENLLSALENTLGVVSTACKKCSISRKTFYEYKKNDKDFANAVDDISEICLDFAESQLFKQIKDGNTTATIFFLKTKGKKRGYIERMEMVKKDVDSFESKTEEELLRDLKKYREIAKD